MLVLHGPHVMKSWDLKLTSEFIQGEAEGLLSATLDPAAQDTKYFTGTRGFTQGSFSLYTSGIREQPRRLSSRRAPLLQPRAQRAYSALFLVLAKDGDPYVGYTQEICGASTSHVLSSCPPASSSRILTFMGFKAGGQTTRVLDAEDKTNLLVLQAPKRKPGIFTCFKAQPLISSDSALGKVWPRH